MFSLCVCYAIYNCLLATFRLYIVALGPSISDNFATVESEKAYDLANSSKTCIHKSSPLADAATEVLRQLVLDVQCLFQAVMDK